MDGMQQTQKKMPNKLSELRKPTFSHTLSHSFSTSHPVSDSMSQIKFLPISHSIFSIISYISQWLISPMLQKLFNTFFVLIKSSKMQRCLTNDFRKRILSNKSFHTPCRVKYMTQKTIWVRNSHTFSFCLLFFNINPINKLFLLPINHNPINSLISTGKVIAKHTP